MSYQSISNILLIFTAFWPRQGVHFTVVLFLKRKAQMPEPAEHYLNRVRDFFEGDRECTAIGNLGH